MNQLRITIVVKEADDDEAIALKQAIEKMLEKKVGATVTMILRPSASPGW